MPRLKPLRGSQVNWSHPLARGLAGCWLLNEVTGEIVADQGLRRQHGSFQYSTIAPAWKPAEHGSCLEFGSERYLACRSGKFGWDVTNELSVVAYANPAASQSSTIFARSAFVRPVRLAGYSGGKIRWWVYTNGTNCNIISTSAHATDGTEWIHVVGTWKQHDGRIYVNGRLETSESSSSGNLSFVSDSQPVGIGGTYEGGSYYECWTGGIEYVLVYSRALSPAEVQWLYREPFAMFERPVSPASIYAAGATVSLAGSISSTSSASAQLESVLNWPALERTWLLDALFNGMTANAFKLGTILHLGWFWTRVAGCCALYRGLGMEQIDFANILAVAANDAAEISSPSYLSHDNNSTYFYVLRKFNRCGDLERTLAAAAKVSFDANGDLADLRPNKIFALKAEQADTNTVRLTWLYCPLEQESPPVRFNLYSDDGTGQIDFNNPIAAVDYHGPKFYSYQRNALQPGRYLFAVRAQDADGIENSSSDILTIELDGSSPDAIEILHAQTV
jgi:Concanavalin A-like lectin/glucanases superfamily